MFCSCILSGVISELYWYCLMKATIRSFQEWTREGSKLVYQVTAAPVRWERVLALHNMGTACTSQCFSSLTYNIGDWTTYLIYARRVSRIHLSGGTGSDNCNHIDPHYLSIYHLSSAKRTHAPCLLIPLQTLPKFPPTFFFFYTTFYIIPHMIMSFLILILFSSNTKMHSFSNF